MVQLHNSALTSRASLQSVREREQVSLSSVPSWRSGLPTPDYRIPSEIRPAESRGIRSQSELPKIARRCRGIGSWRRTLCRSDTDFVPGCLIQLSTNICVPIYAGIITPISDKSHASTWRAFSRRCMRIHANPGPSGEIFLRFCSQPAPFLQIRRFRAILSLEATPHGGTFEYYLFSIRFAYIYSSHEPPSFFTPRSFLELQSVEYGDTDFRPQKKNDHRFRMVIDLFRLYLHVVIRTGGCLITDELLLAFSYCRFVLKHGRMNLLGRTMGFPGNDEL